MRSHRPTSAAPFPVLYAKARTAPQYEKPEATRLWVTTIPDEQDELALLDRIVERRRGVRNFITMFDVDRECPHGRVPGDRSDACGCFPGEEVEHPGKQLRVTPDLMLVAQPVRQQQLTCACCGGEWQRPAQVGRPPKKCPSCRPAAPVAA